MITDTGSGVAPTIAAGAVATVGTDAPLHGIPASLEELVPWFFVTVTLYALGWLGKGLDAYLAVRFPRPKA